MNFVSIKHINGSRSVNFEITQENSGKPIMIDWIASYVPQFVVVQDEGGIYDVTEQIISLVKERTVTGIQLTSLLNNVHSLDEFDFIPPMALDAFSDEELLKLYTEFAEEDMRLANSGLMHYTDALVLEDYA